MFSHPLTPVDFEDLNLCRNTRHSKAKHGFLPAHLSIFLKLTNSVKFLPQVANSKSVCSEFRRTKDLAGGLNRTAMADCSTIPDFSLKTENKCRPLSVTAHKVCLVKDAQVKLIVLLKVILYKLKLGGVLSSAALSRIRMLGGQISSRRTLICLRSQIKPKQRNKENLHSKRTVCTPKEIKRYFRGDPC